MPIDHNEAYSQRPRSSNAPEDAPVMIATLFSAMVFSEDECRRKRLVGRGDQVPPLERADMAVRSCDRKFIQARLFPELSG